MDANGREYKGHVDSIAGASGARFSLLPPENATGNYVKVVQRVPVKIVLDPGENSDHSAAAGHVRANRRCDVQVSISAAIPARAANPSGPAINPWVIALVVTLATFMEVLDTSIANVALPHIAGGLSAGSDESTWMLTSYLVSNAIVLPMSGWFSTLIGRKRFYMTCVALFTISSLLCGLAPSLGALIFFRVLQGAGGGGCSPANRRFSPTLSRPKSAAWRSPSTAWPWCWRRPSAPRSAAGSPTTTVGAGFSIINVPVGIISLLLTIAADHRPAAT